MAIALLGSKSEKELSYNVMMTKVCTETNETWEFDATNGCLYHPCGFLTSWFRHTGGWVLDEAATTTLPEEIVSWVSELN